ncbi:hypothetical protein ARHIZOSPH14_19760 [Agromyces rhizosphaerae]|uniref:Uncharacterized protein n=1 Tax=Agromyces rhizosphaerae TaxID=88374 RepID=A0A9W6FP77_9MICO|nr:hypothetical protein [Agromyces rhizosphaerae]GLI27734.1 hypothetical protein ARHIZOSPH14_19760 [Agromyces rhizosphaerae]
MPPIDPDLVAAFGRIFRPATAMTVRVDFLERLGAIFGGRPPGQSLPSVRLFRPRDLIDVEFRFVNLELRGTGTRRVVAREIAGRPAQLIAIFGPQHLLEQAFFDAAGPEGDFVSQNAETGGTPPAGGSEMPKYPVQAILSRPSRLAFRVTEEEIPFTETGLLAAMRLLPLSVAPHAVSFTPFRRFPDLVTDVGAVLEATTRASSFLEEAARRAVLRERLAARPDAAASVELANLELAPDASASALATAAAAARLHRTVGLIEARFGPASAVGAVASGAGAIIDLSPALALDLRPSVPREPTSTETAIELPWRLQLSPHATGGFMHSIDDVTHDGRVELWHTRLGTRDAEAGQVFPIAAATTSPVDEEDPDTRQVRAIWTRDFRPGKSAADEVNAFPQEDFGDLGTLPPFRASLSVKDRMQLVHRTSNHRWSGEGNHVRPAQVEHLMLTGLGGWLASEADFGDEAPGLNLQEWRHRATMARDHYVKVVYAGILAPFGHRASLVKITERRVAGDGRATLYQRLFIIVRQPERAYLHTGVADFDNVMPFRWVRIITRSTPPLALPHSLITTSGQVFVPEIATADVGQGGAAPSGSTPFVFKFLANDVDNHLVEFEGPLVFLETTAVDSKADDPVGAVDAANSVAHAYGMGGQLVAYAEPDEDNDPGDTALPTTTLTFDATVHGGKPNYVVPHLRVAMAPVPAMAAFTGQSGPVPLRIADAYRGSRFAAGNAGGLFLELADAAGAPLPTAPPTMDFGSQSDRSGAFLSPSIGVKALARKVGPVGGDLATLAANPANFDLGAMFPASAAKLFGVINLQDLLPAANGVLPKFVTQVLDAAATAQQTVARAQAFVTAKAAELAALGANVQNAATALATKAQAFTDAIGQLAADPDAAPNLDQVIADIGAAAGTIATALDDAGPNLPLARPEVEQAASVMHLLADVAGTAGTVVTALRNLYKGLAVPEQVSARLEWSTELGQWPANAAKPIFEPKDDRMLRLVAEVQAPLDASKSPGALVSCSLPPFDLRLVGDAEFIIIRVAVMAFSVRGGKKPDVDVQLDDKKGIEFVGPLAFIEAIKKVIPFDGFSDPPYLDVSTSGITAGFDLAIPDLAVGVFALTNINVGARLSVPFIGESLEFRFNFATRDDPFRLQVSLFAGGGFFALTVAPDGMRVVEAALEFGAAVSMNFGVASGSISVMAGIYFRLEQQGDDQLVQLSGYFRARGEVDVLGLISACIELYLELSYRNQNGNEKAVGKASISIEVSVCFVSFSVSVSCEKQFAGSKGDPTFVDMMGPFQALGVPKDPWADYCAAFAPEAP